MVVGRGGAGGRDKAGRALGSGGGGALLTDRGTWRQKSSMEGVVSGEREGQEDSESGGGLEVMAVEAGRRGGMDSEGTGGRRGKGGRQEA